MGVADGILDIADAGRMAREVEGIGGDGAVGGDLLDQRVERIGHHRAQHSGRSRHESAGAIIDEGDDRAVAALDDQVGLGGSVELGDLGGTDGALVAVGTVEEGRAGDSGGAEWGDDVTAISPSQNRASPFPSTRLKPL